MEGIGDLVRDNDALLVIDRVTSLGSPVLIDEWKVDAALGTQKCLSCPPGLAPLTFGNAPSQKWNQKEQAS